MWTSAEALPGASGALEDHILGLIQRDLAGLRDDAELHRQVEEQLGRLRSGRSDAREQLGRRLAAVDQELAKVRDHVLALDADTARSLSIYDQAKKLNAERVQVEAELRAARPDPELPALPELRQRIAAEFDRMEALLAAGTLEERRALVGCYVHAIKTVPEEATVCIGLFPGVLSQMVEGSRRPSSQSTCEERSDCLGRGRAACPMLIQNTYRSSDR